MKKVTINIILSNVVYFLLLINLCSCGSNSEPKPTFFQRIISAKTKDVKNGTTCYKFAYSNGQNDEVSFGLYVKYDIGDTVCFKKENGIIGWTSIVDCTN